MILTIVAALFVSEGQSIDAPRPSYERVIDDALVPGTIERLIEYRRTARLDVKYASSPQVLTIRRPLSRSTFEILEQTRRHRVTEAALRGGPIPELSMPAIDVRATPLEEWLRAAILIGVAGLIITTICVLALWMLAGSDP
jgi:hypothetical protein